MSKMNYLSKGRLGAHGGGVRGDGAVVGSESFEGRFGRIFRGLPAGHWPADALRALGLAMTADAEVDSAGNPSASPETADVIQDDEENAGLPAGYTYFGQFIDHDITFDPASSLQKHNDPDALVDFRTPRLDLDSLYGRGPEDQPYMYVGNKFRLGRKLKALDQPTRSRDLPRYLDPDDTDGPKRAIIGDKRNDENVIVSQLHSALLQFHNKLVDQSPTATFVSIQQQVRWHYQWLVVNDFLVRLCGEDVVKSILPHLGKNEPLYKNEPQFAIYKWKNEAFMPIEFSAAAYRFGHSMVRPIYRLNQQLNGGAGPVATPDEVTRGLAGRFFVFAGVQERGLNGFDQFPDQWAIDWKLFFDSTGSVSPGGKARVQPAYKIDTSLVNPLGFLPEFSVTAPPPADGSLTLAQLQGKPVDPVNSPANLAERNLLRGGTMGLPSGQTVARSLGLKPIADKDLRIGKATLGDSETNKPITEVHPAFAHHAPLWFYVLAEAQHEWLQRAKKPGSAGDKEPVRLGPVGARIVAETLIGLLWADSHSYLRQAPNWAPDTIRVVGDLLNFALS